MSDKDRYFPPGAFDSREELDQMTQSWYSQQLHALEEPSLWAESDDRWHRIYRFLYLRTFDAPVVVRIHIKTALDRKIRPKKRTARRLKGLLFVKVADGAGGYEPGDIVVNEARPLSHKEVKALLFAIQNLQFWEMPTIEKHMGLDGAQWVLEGLRKGRYHIVDRWCPGKGLYRETCLYFLELSPLEDIGRIY